MVELGQSDVTCRNVKFICKSRACTIVQPHHLLGVVANCNFSVQLCTTWKSYYNIDNKKSRTIQSYKSVEAGTIVGKTRWPVSGITTTKPVWWEFLGRLLYLQYPYLCENWAQ